MFFNTLPIIFNFIHLFNALEAVIFLTTVFFLVYFYTSEVSRVWAEAHYKSLYALLHGCWLGNAALWRAFWPFFVLVNGVFFYIDYRIDNVTYTIASWKTVHGMLFLPIIWWTVAVWRCSANTHRKIWAVAARTMTVYIFIDLILRFYISNKFPHMLFDCRLLLIEYGDCL